MSADCSPAVAQAMADSQVANQKIVQDTFASRENQSILDNQANARGWNEHNLTLARDAQTLKFLATVAQLTSTQTGETENQAPNTPIAQKAADSQIQVPPGSAYPPNRQTDTAGASAVAGIQAAMQSLADNVANLQSAMTAFMAASAPKTPAV